MSARIPVAEDFNAIRAGVARLDAGRRALLYGGVSVSAQQAGELRRMLSAGLPAPMMALLSNFHDEVGITGAKWKLQAGMLTSAMLRTVCWLRDYGYLQLSLEELRTHLSLERLTVYANKGLHPDLPTGLRGALQDYLRTLPGYREELGAIQAAPALDEHDFLQTRLCAILLACEVVA